MPFNYKLRWHVATDVIIESSMFVATYYKYNNQAWDYSLWRKPLDRTLSLARMVNLLSTKVLSDSLVSSNAAFFGVWRITRRILLLVYQSSACLASSSIPLRTYVFNPNKHVHLASFSAPHCLSTVALSAFYSIPEQAFAFLYKQCRTWTDTFWYQFRCSTKLSYLRTYQDVLLQLLHTLLDTKYNTPPVFRLADY